MQTLKKTLLIVLGLILLTFLAGIFSVFIKSSDFIAIFMSFGVFGLGAAFALIGISYHMKTLKYYDASAALKKNEELPVIVWLFSIFGYLYFICVGYVTIWVILQRNFLMTTFERISIFLLVFAMLLSIVSIIEAFLTKRKIARYRKEVVVFHEIDEIGDAKS